jgi:hypothetical protein
MTRFEICQEVRAIMREVWDERIGKDEPLADQIRHMIRWKPRWTHDERPLNRFEIDCLNELANDALNLTVRRQSQLASSVMNLV